MEQLIQGLEEGGVIAGAVLLSVACIDYLLFFKWWHSSRLESSSARAFSVFALSFLVLQTRIEALDKRGLVVVENELLRFLVAGLLIANVLFLYFNYLDKPFFAWWQSRYRLRCRRRAERVKV
ncbi:MAG: hypothetical protein HY459_01900 [Parcubacteria group bacterium]|nr:hypothetical protein [Parcubacteria group bacterium]